LTLDNSIGAIPNGGIVATSQVGGNTNFVPGNWYGGGARPAGDSSSNAGGADWDVIDPMVSRFTINLPANCALKGVGMTSADVIAAGGAIVITMGNPAGMDTGHNNFVIATGTTTPLLPDTSLIYLDKPVIPGRNMTFTGKVTTGTGQAVVFAIYEEVFG